VLALLAFAGAPALAQAEECDAACIQYWEPGVVPRGGVKHPKSEGVTEQKVTPDQPRPDSGEAEPPESESAGESERKHAAGGGGGESRGGKGPGGGQAPIGVGGAQALGGGAGQGTAPTHLGGGGGSSPLLPVLAVVAALAALSFGAVIYRQRRDVPIG
jgi:hypothetical protein